MGAIPFQIMLFSLFVFSRPFDERHFRAMRPLHAEAFTILPADAPPPGG